MAGTLYGIGVGPGDPELITIKAARTLERVRTVFAAASTKNDYSTALDIARDHMPEDVRIIRLGFPMTRDEALLDTAWQNNARIVADVLDAGEDAAFLTLGDPLIYSTFGYLMRTLSALRPDLPVTVISGITSYQASAAHTATVLCESGENLLLISGVENTDKLAETLCSVDNAVILKTYRNFGEIKNALENAGKNGETVFVSRLGMDNQHICPLNEAPEKPHYFSHVLVPKKR